MKLFHFDSNVKNSKLCSQIKFVTGPVKTKLRIRLVLALCKCFLYKNVLLREQKQRTTAKNLTGNLQF